jgi:hypothetical protein
MIALVVNGLDVQISQEQETGEGYWEVYWPECKMSLVTDSFRVAAIFAVFDQP